ncbi:MAG: hypothetical protein ONB23_01995 [candidate division KSB1 bacterium]|nr:hypothetical protein [candidate division KSB1 bacterium]
MGGAVRTSDGWVFWSPDGRRERRYRLVPMPEEFVRWQLEARRHLYRRLSEAKEEVHFAPPHLPVLATRNPRESDHPINLSVKGIALFPVRELLGPIVQQIERMLAQAAPSPLPLSLAQRSDFVAGLFREPGEVDRYAFGGLEIFEGTTFRNLGRDPRATLLFVGDGPEYPCYQFDVVSEIVREGDLRYRYLSGLRRLFEGDSFHVRQTRYPWGYVFWIVGVRDKTPRPRS